MEVNKIHCGQYRPYGDSFYVWEVKTDETDREKILQECKENLAKRDLPIKADWKQSIMYGHDKSGDLNYYFAGYCDLDGSNGRYNFTVCHPYCD